MTFLASLPSHPAPFHAHIAPEEQARVHIGVSESNHRADRLARDPVLQGIAK